MSLEGLYDLRVGKAYETAASKDQGWFLLKYSSRDEVELLREGIHGVCEIRRSLEQYVGSSPLPLYGFLKYGQRRVILKYVPEDLSLSAQARVTVHFDAVCDRFSPCDVVFEISTGTSLTDAELSAACSKQAASGFATPLTTPCILQWELEGNVRSGGGEEPPPRRTVSNGNADPITCNSDLEPALHHSNCSTDDVAGRRKNVGGRGRRSISNLLGAEGRPRSGFDFRTKPNVGLGPRPSRSMNVQPQKGSNPRPVSVIPSGYTLGERSKMEETNARANSRQLHSRDSPTAAVSQEPLKQNYKRTLPSTTAGMSVKIASTHSKEETIADSGRTVNPIRLLNSQVKVVESSAAEAPMAEKAQVSTGCGGDKDPVQTSEGQVNIGPHKNEGFPSQASSGAATATTFSSCSDLVSDFPRVEPQTISSSVTSAGVSLMPQSTRQGGIVPRVNILNGLREECLHIKDVELSRVPSTVSHHSPSVPMPAFISTAHATNIIASSLNGHFHSWYDCNGIQCSGGLASVSDGALTLVNGFLDQLLFNFVQASASTSLNSLREAVLVVLKPKLANKAIRNADEELHDYLGEAEDEISVLPEDSVLTRSEREDIWRRARLLCMVYSAFGDIEEDHELMYMEQENLRVPTDGQLSSVVISSAAAIFLTSVVEYLGELALTAAGKGAHERAISKMERELKDGTRRTGDQADRLIIETLDMERLAFDRALGRLWRSWKKIIRCHEFTSFGLFSHNSSLLLQQDCSAQGKLPGLPSESCRAVESVNSAGRVIDTSHDASTRCSVPVQPRGTERVHLDDCHILRGSTCSRTANRSLMREASVNSKYSIISSEVATDTTVHVIGEEVERVLRKVLCDPRDLKFGESTQIHHTTQSQSSAKTEENLVLAHRNLEPSPRTCAPNITKTDRSPFGRFKLRGIGNITSSSLSMAKYVDCNDRNSQSLNSPIVGNGYIPLQVKLPVETNKYDTFVGRAGRFLGSPTSSTSGRTLVRKLEPREAACYNTMSPDLIAFLRDSEA